MKALDLFSGCGGMSLGFQNAGFEIIAAFDNWKPAIDVYRSYFKHPIFEIDLSNDEEYHFLTKFTPDLIMGGPPCQDFSSAGKRDENLGRADLTVVFAKIVTLIKPRWVVMENVERAIKSKAYSNAYNILQKSEYGLTKIILDASYCGVPQKRKRLFLIGELGGKDDALLPYLRNNLSTTQTTLRKYFGNNLDFEHYYRHPRSYQRRAVFSIDEPSPTVRGVNRPIPSTYAPHIGDTTTIKITPSLRPLTTKERSLIQTFPDNFFLNGSSKVDAEQMIGNAVPVKLAEYVANCILEYIYDKNNMKCKKVDMHSEQLALPIL
jgi:DNA (cytosine-5)-methyltransferase 1